MTRSVWQEPLPEETYPEPWWKNRLVLLAGICFLCILVLVLVWYTLVPSSPSSSAGSREEVPFVEADPSQYRTKPEDPGGYAFPHQDKKVYELIEPSKKKDVVAIKPAPEKPLPIEERTLEPLSSKEEVVTENVERTSTQEKQGTHYIQIGALRSKKAANSQWLFLKKVHKSLLSGRSIKIVKALNKGTPFYRLFVGPFPTDAKAKSICRQWKKSGLDCLPRDIS